LQFEVEKEYLKGDNNQRTKYIAKVEKVHNNDNVKMITAREILTNAEKYTQYDTE
jgi:hypothetical protein